MQACICIELSDNGYNVSGLGILQQGQKGLIIEFTNLSINHLTNAFIDN